ncbi:hypothetical protein HNQ92_000358 [Rhabdobacter roseus]|uniref:Uncharacterized protein n=1 Tax=Rhabdobacter roseus TaxID=1655419 RepID=A0A840TKA8_9BACT|nr:hypothetical protein [Rhabdobacter roseus]MBB5282237.1 hypothetical protein [Rhabdobacter roseus]
MSKKEDKHELDELFRGNARYLADQPPRGFDQEAVWQQLQTQLPLRPRRRKWPIAWVAAAAVVALTVLVGGVWVLWPEPGTLPVAQPQVPKYPASPAPSQVPVAPGTLAAATTKQHSQVPARQVPSAPEPKAEAIVPPPSTPAEVPAGVAPPEVAEVLAEAGSAEGTLVVKKPEKPRFRVVHVNELRAPEVPQTPSRLHVAVRIGLPGPAEVPVATEARPWLRVPLP